MTLAALLFIAVLDGRVIALSSEPSAQACRVSAAGIIADVAWQDGPETAARVRTVCVESRRAEA